MKRYHAMTGLGALLTAAAVWTVSVQALDTPDSPQRLKTGSLERSTVKAGKTGGVVTGTPTRGIARMKREGRSPAAVARAPKRIMTASPRGHLYGTVTAYSSMTLFEEAYWGEINPETGAVTRLFNGSDLINGNDYYMQSGAVRDGILYTPVVNEGLSGFSIDWNRRDLATGDKMVPLTFNANWDAYAYSMTYDPDRDVFHILSVDATAGAFNIYTRVYPGKTDSDWRVERVGKVSCWAHLGSLAYHPGDGQLYGIASDNQLYILDPETGQGYEAGMIDDYYSPIVQDGNSLAMTYSPLDGAFAIMYVDMNAEEMRLLYLDGETYEITEGPAMTPEFPFFSCLYSPDAYASSEATEMPAPVEYTFDGPALSGTLSVTAPTHSYAGLTLSEKDRIHMVLTVDDAVLLDETVAPGSTFDIAYDSEQGLHRAELTCELNGEAGPKRVTMFYTGHDNPAMPEDVRLEGSVLKWKDTGTESEHGGYVEPGAVTYDIYADDVKLNDAPVTGTEYTLPALGDLGRKTLGVTANANGMASKPGTLSAVVGEALALPWDMAPTAEEAKLFSTVNVAGDEPEFGYVQNEATGDWRWEIYLDRYYDGDDWLFLPLSSFPDKDVLYNLSFTYQGATPYESTEGFSVALGRQPNPSAMEHEIYSDPAHATWGPEKISMTFPVPEAGDWYIGIHCTTQRGRGMGIALTEFSLKSLAERSSRAPGDPVVSIHSADEGRLEAEVSITAPTIDLVGRELDADSDITFTVLCGDNESVASARPGETVTTTVTATSAGYNEIKVTPSSADGVGLTRTYRAYIGIDVPLSPAGFTVTPTEDNLSLVLEWKSAGKVGENGGYVDEDKLEYVVYTITSSIFNPVAVTKDNKYVFTPYTSTPDRYIVTVSARNEVGESTYTSFTTDLVGTPYPVPVKENFGSMKFDYDPLVYNTDTEYSNSIWNAASSITSYPTGCNTDFSQGGMTVTSLASMGGAGELILPKVTTRGTESAVFRLRWLDWAETPEFSIWGRCHGHNELECLGTFKPEYPAVGVWRDDEIQLPEAYNDCGWAEFRIHANLSGSKNEYGFIDSYSVLQEVDRDLKISSIEAPEGLTVGDSGLVTVTVLNGGTEAIGGKLNITVADAEGNVRDSYNADIIRVAAADRYLFPFNLDAVREYLDGGKIVITATVECEGDRIPSNNTMERVIEVNGGMAPSVGDLKARWTEDHKGAELSWSEPDLTYGGLDGFEFLEPFVLTEDLGQWRNLDLDGELPFRIAGLDWPNNAEACAWQPIDAQQLNLMNDARLCPHSGRMYLMARSISFDEDAEEEPIQANDWLISPEVIGGTEIGFWYGTATNAYAEYVELWVSQTDRDPESFTRVRSFSKEGDEAWEEVRYTLPEGTRYFALVYRSWDSLAAMIDDITFTPARLESWVVDHYAVMRTSAGQADFEVARVKDLHYTDLELPQGEVAYHVLTAVATSDGFRYGPRSNTATLEGSMVDDMKDLTGVTGGAGYIRVTGLDGRTLSLYGTDGAHLRSVTIHGDDVTVPCEAGIYVAKCGNAYGKVLVTK